MPSFIHFAVIEFLCLSPNSLQGIFYSSYFSLSSEQLPVCDILFLIVLGWLTMIDIQITFRSDFLFNFVN